MSNSDDGSRKATPMDMINKTGPTDKSNRSGSNPTLCLSDRVPTTAPTSTRQATKQDNLRTNVTKDNIIPVQAMYDAHFHLGRLETEIPKTLEKFYNSCPSPTISEIGIKAFDETRLKNPTPKEVKEARIKKETAYEQYVAEHCTVKYHSPDGLRVFAEYREQPGCKRIIAWTPEFSQEGQTEKQNLFEIIEYSNIASVAGIRGFMQARDYYMKGGLFLQLSKKRSYAVSNPRKEEGLDSFLTVPDAVAVIRKRGFDNLYDQRRFLAVTSLHEKVMEHFGSW